MFSVALGVSTIRIVEPLLVALTGLGSRKLFGTALWIGWLITLAAAEFWVRWTRGREGAVPLAAEAGAARPGIT